MEEASIILLFMPFHTQTNMLQLFGSQVIHLENGNHIIMYLVKRIWYREMIVIINKNYFPPLYLILEDYIPPVINPSNSGKNSLPRRLQSCMTWMKLLTKTNGILHLQQWYAETFHKRPYFKTNEKKLHHSSWMNIVISNWKWKLVSRGSLETCGEMT